MPLYGDNSVRHSNPPVIDPVASADAAIVLLLIVAVCLWAAVLLKKLAAKEEATPEAKRTALSTFLIHHLSWIQDELGKFTATEQLKLQSAINSGALNAEESALLEKALDLGIAATGSLPMANMALAALKEIDPQWRQQFIAWCLSNENKLFVKLVPAPTVTGTPTK